MGNRYERWFLVAMIAVVVLLVVAAIIVLAQREEDSPVDGIKLGGITSTGFET